MAGDDRKPSPPDPTEEQVLQRFRIVSIRVILALIALDVFADNVGRLFIDPQFHASELIFGTLIGALLITLGVEALDRLPGGKTSR